MSPRADFDKIFDKKTANLKKIMIENEDNYIIHVKEKYKDEFNFVDED